MGVHIGLFIFFIPLISSQSLYGINQLDSYSRIIQSNNVGGLGLLQDAIMKGKVHDVQSEVLGQPKLSGLPPLPVQRGTPILDSDVLSPPHVIKSHPTTTTSRTPSNVHYWGINNVPELPPRDESKIGGYYDEDGEFHPMEKKEKKRKVNKIKDEDKDLIDEVPHVITPARIDENPHPLVTSHRISRQEAFDVPTARNIERRVRREHNNKVVRQVTPPTQTVPPFQYRPKPKPMNRDVNENNLLSEVEEYDDWLDQREAYQNLYPGRRVSNPYENVPPGTVLFEGVPPRPEISSSIDSIPQQVPPPPPLNSQFNQFSSQQPFPQQIFRNPPPLPNQFPTLNNFNGGPPIPLHSGPHFVQTRAIQHPNEHKPTIVQPMIRGPNGAPIVVPPPNGFNGPTPLPGLIVSIPPGGRIPPGFFPIARPPQISQLPPPPSIGHILETRDRLMPKSPYENPLVTFFSKLFGKPSGAQSIAAYGSPNIDLDDDEYEWDEDKKSGKGKREISSSIESTTKISSSYFPHPSFPTLPPIQPNLVDFHNQNPVVLPVFSPSQFIFPQIFPSDGAISPSIG